jgi:hypothetical protein
MSDIPTDVLPTDGSADGIGYSHDDLEPVVFQNTEVHERFVSAIKIRTRDILAPAGCADDLIDLFGTALAEEVDCILLKFKKGQLKHGGDIRDRNLPGELHMELQDALVYSIVDRLRGTRNNAAI